MANPVSYSTVGIQTEIPPPYHREENVGQRKGLSLLVHKVIELFGKIFDALYRLLPGRAGATLRENNRMYKRLGFLEVQYFCLTNGKTIFDKVYPLVRQENEQLAHQVERLTQERDGYQQSYLLEYQSNETLSHNNASYSAENAQLRLDLVGERTKLSQKEGQIRELHETNQRLTQDVALLQEQIEQERATFRSRLHERRSSSSSNLHRLIDDIAAAYDESTFPSAPPMTLRAPHGSTYPALPMYAPPVANDLP